jgi:fructose-bisphosphate aldolase, class I
MEGNFTLERSLAAHIAVLSTVFHKLHVHNVLLEGMLLKVSMVILPNQKASPRQVADATLAALSRTVPPALPGIVFLSGGQGDEEAVKNLQAINETANKDRSRHPWKLSFSYGRALQGEAMKAWAKGDIKQAKSLFVERAKSCWEASKGEYRGK